MLSFLPALVFSNSSFLCLFVCLFNTLVLADLSLRGCVINMCLIVQTPRQAAWVQVQAWPCVSWVVLSKSLALPVPWFPHLWNGDDFNKTTYLIGILWRVKVSICKAFRTVSDVCNLNTNIIIILGSVCKFGWGKFISIMLFCSFQLFFLFIFSKAKVSTDLFP